jgi:hypothetical protein
MYWRTTATAAAAAAAPQASMTGLPKLRTVPPWLYLQMRLQQMYEDTHLAMLELDARVLDVPWLWKHTYYFR